MNKSEIVTLEDLIVFGEKLKNDITGIIQAKINPLKEFYTPKEFAGITGMPYSTVVHKCTHGKLKAYQESPNCSWLIYATEIERFKKVADENFDNNH